MRLDLLDIAELAALALIGLVLYQRMRKRDAAAGVSGGRPRFVLRSVLIFLGSWLLLGVVAIIALSRGA